MAEPPLQSPGPVVRWKRLDGGLSATHAQGVTRLQAVAPDILRIQFSPDGEFAPRRAWDMVKPLPAVSPRVTERSGSVCLETGSLTALFNPVTGLLAFQGADEQQFAADIAAPGWREITLGELPLEHMPEPTLPSGRACRGLFLHKRMAVDEGYYGFGQRSGRLNRRHRRLTHWTVDRSSPGHSRGNDNMYQVHPFFLALRPGFCWGLFLKSTWFSSFDVGAAQEAILTLFTLGGELEYYLFAGPTPAAVVEQLTRLTGRPALPPLWALGYHQSRWSYRDEKQVRAVVDGFRQRRLPLDAIHLDIDYMNRFRVFTWHRQRFPDPAGMIDHLHHQGIRCVPIVDPGVKRELAAGYPLADEGVSQGHFLKNPDGTLFSGFVWPGESLFPDFCRGTTRYWWGEQHAGLLQAGVDGIWCDMNEPAIVDRPFGQPGVHDQPVPLSVQQGDQGEALHAETHNLYGSLMARATAEGLQRQRPNRRPWVLTRSAFLGSQRWAASWMGDNSAWWEHLEMSLPQLASMGLCGSPHVGVDIGGFYHNCSPELYARWIQLGSFYPFMRGHSHFRTRPHEPWAFGPEVETIARQALELRYRLLPYLYTLAHRAQRTGEPLFRPLLYDFPDQAELHQIEDQMMIGPQLMIAPVLKPGIRRRLVELPQGNWFNLSSGSLHPTGPLIVEAPLARIPRFVRAGSILTLGNIRQSTAEPLTELTLEVFPHPVRRSSWTLIEDDGESLGYHDGRIAETRYEVIPGDRQLKFSISARHGRYLPASRDLVVRLHLSGTPATIILDEIETLDYAWDPTHFTLELRWLDDGMAHSIEVNSDG